MVIAIKIENGLVKEHGSNSSRYTNHSRTVLANLMRSKQFKEKIMTGKINPEVVATMDPKEMQDESQKKKQLEMEKNIVQAKRSDFMIANMKSKPGMYQ